MTPDDPRHGRNAGYLAHWKEGEDACPPCLRAHKRNQQEFLVRQARGEVRSVDATGTRRRVQALAAIGWSVMEQARQLGVAEMAIRGILAKTSIWASTATRHAALYDRLIALPPPTGRGPTAARTHAAKHGWAPPSAWFDIDDPDEQPDFGGDGRMSAAEKLAEFEWLTSLGVAEPEALRQVDWTREAMEKHLERQKKEAA